MPRKKANFSADDVFRIINGAQRAGLRVSRCEVSPDGQIALFSSADAPRLPEVEETATKQSVLERWLADENAR